MPVYSNPGFAQGVANLAKLFEPPSGADAAGWASANARNAEANRLQALYDYTKAKDYDPALAERQAIAAGVYNPSQSFEVARMGDATTRRGQDAESGDRRYATDTTARTTLATNAADNARASATNDADNARALRDREMQEAGSLQRFFASPIKLNQGETAILPDQTAAATGLDPRLSGAPKPMSETEWRAGQDERLRQSGQLSDQMLIDTILGSRTPVEALGPGGKPVYMSPGQAVRAGAQPVPKAPTTVISNAGEGSFDKTIGEKQAGLFIDLATDGVDARNDRALLDRLDEQTKDLPGGMLGGLQSLASGYGIKLGPNASNVEAANAIIARLVPAARQGMPGAASDRDVSLFKASLPSLSQTPEGRRIVSDTLRGLAQAREQQARIATAVVNGEMTRSEGMTALQNLPDAFAALRDAAGAPASDLQAGLSSQPPASRPAGPDFRQGQPGGAQIARPTSDVEFDALPAGALYVDPDDGKTYRK